MAQRFTAAIRDLFSTTGLATAVRFRISPPNRSSTVDLRTSRYISLNRCCNLKLMSLITKPRARRPRWFWIVPRVVLVTFILTLFSFAISLFLGILGVVIGSRLRGIHPNMAFAYRHIAAPAAAIVGSIVLVSATAMEIRHYRQSRALAEIERVSGHSHA